MALGRQGERQADLMIGWAELPRSPGHAFYDRLQAVLIEAGLDRIAEVRIPTMSAGHSEPKSATCSDPSRPAVPIDVGRGGGSPAGRW